MQVREIKIVSVGNYIGAVKLGRCPMYSFAPKIKASDFFESLKEDFPNYHLVKGGEKEKNALIFNIKMSGKIR